MTFSLAITSLPACAMDSQQFLVDSREPIALSPPEANAMRSGMRTYLEAIQGIIAAMTNNDMTLVSDISKQSGAQMLHTVSPAIGLKLPVGFAMMSFDTHDRFDKLSEKARRGTSRSEILSDLRDIMGNCTSCHSSYRLTR